jgi:hypothetical protein
MTTTQEETSIRAESFACDRPAEIEVRMSAGRLDVRPAQGPQLRVRVAIEPAEGPRWERGVEDVLERLSGGDYDPAEADAHALRETEIVFSEGRRRLVVRTPRRLRRIRLAVEIEAPSGSSLTAYARNSTVSVSVPLSRLSVRGGRSDIDAERVDGPVEVAIGSGDLRLGRAAGRLRVRSGNGAIEITSLEGDAARLVLGGGDVWLGVVHADVQARSGRGSITVAEAAAGKLDLVSGSGNVEVGIRPGVVAELDLVSGSGQARSELDVRERTPPTPASVRVRARTGSGDVVVSRAAD